VADVVHEGLRIRTQPDVYVPSPNTHLLAAHAAAGAGRTVVEVGCGAGLASLVAARSGARAIALDRNPVAVELARANAARNGLRIEGVVADLLGPVRPERIDVLLANLPWVPSPDEPGPEDGFALATRGGPGGMGVLLRLVEALAHGGPRLPEGFEGHLVVATLQDVAAVRALLEQAGFAVDADAAGLDEALVRLHLRR
jgi:release factor glutamine methyltransferase